MPKVTYEIMPPTASDKSYRIIKNECGELILLSEKFYILRAAELHIESLEDDDDGKPKGKPLMMM